MECLADYIDYVVYIYTYIHTYIHIYIIIVHQDTTVQLRVKFNHTHHPYLITLYVIRIATSLSQPACQSVMLLVSVSKPFSVCSKQ